MLIFRRRLGLTYQAAILVVLIAAALTAYWSLSRAAHGQLDAALLALAKTEAGMLAQEGAAPIRVHEAATAGSAPMSFVRLDRLVQIIDADGRPIARSTNLGTARLPVHPSALARAAAGEIVFETLHNFGEEPTRLVTLLVRVRVRVGVGVGVGGSGGETLLAVQVAGSLDDVHHVINTSAGLFATLGAVLLLSVGAAGALLMRHVFRAIDDVVRKARRIGDEDLSQRLPHPGSADEIGRLVDTLNEMLARIEHGYDVQRRFTADASHELRSPLSRLRTELELTLRRPREPEAYVETLRSGLEEVERLSLLVEELLAFARIDTGQERGRTERVLLNALTEDAVRRMEPIARARNVTLAIDAAGPVRAKVAPASASLVLDNLLDNAVKFAPPASCVTVQLVVDGPHAVLRVRDTGPGIRRDELTRVFERFYRGPSARAGSTPGMGLGLALSQAIVHAHGGHITASNAVEGGAVFEVRLPAAD